MAAQKQQEGEQQEEGNKTGEAKAAGLDATTTTTPTVLPTDEAIVAEGSKYVEPKEREKGIGNADGSVCLSWHS